jgi:hypothetical protein
MKIFHDKLLISVYDISWDLSTNISGTAQWNYAQKYHLSFQDAAGVFYHSKT